MNGINTTLCYLKRGEEYLMLHRVKKEGDLNRDKWIGIGGKFEAGESPEDCLCREVQEETGLTLHSWRYRGIITFVSDEYGTEYMHLFDSEDFSGEIKEWGSGMDPSGQAAGADPVGGGPRLSAAAGDRLPLLFAEAAV